MELPITSLLFYGFTLLVLFSAIMVVSARNPVHAVLFLIFAFFNAAGLLVLLGAEYLAMTLVIVYVGAVAVLFLFVVMMMDIDFASWRQGFSRLMPLGLSVALALLIQISAVFYTSVLVREHSGSVIFREGSFDPAGSDVTNAEAIGLVLYTDYAYAFLLSGMVLLVAMVGAIVLTLRQRGGVRRQRISRQLARTRAEAVGLVNVKPGEGVSL